MNASLARTVVAVSMLALTACTPANDHADDESSTVTTVTTTHADPSQEAEPDLVAGTAQSPEHETSAPAPAPVHEQAPQSAPAPAQQAGPPAGYNGQAVTVCTNGDGWGISQIAVNANTSCGFANNVLGTLASGIPTTENIRNYLPKNVTAKSPATGQWYEMYCADNGAGIISCRGGNNAEVILQ